MRPSWSRIVWLSGVFIALLGWGLAQEEQPTEEIPVELDITPEDSVEEETPAETPADQFPVIPPDATPDEPAAGVPPNPFVPLDIQQPTGVELTAPAQVGIVMPDLQVQEEIVVGPVTSSISVAPAISAPGLSSEGRPALRVLAVADPENPLVVWVRDHEVRYSGLAAGQVDVAVFASNEGYFTLPEGWTVPGQDIVVESVEPGRVVLAQGVYRLALGGR